MTALLFKLAFAGIRSRLLASALTIAIAGAAAATIVLALEVRSSGRDPWQQTFDAANGAHVLAFAHSQADARAIANLPGVTERSAPVPLVTATLGPTLGPRGSADRVELAGLSGRTAVNMPVLTAGSQLREEGIVLDRSLARARGIEVGATLALTTRRGSIGLPVLGTAVVPASRATPAAIPALPGSPAALSSESSRIAPSGATDGGASTRESLSRLRRLPSRRLPAFRQPRCSLELSTSSPGKTSATTHWPMHSQSSSS